MDNSPLRDRRMEYLPNYNKEKWQSRRQQEGRGTTGAAKIDRKNTTRIRGTFLPDDERNLLGMVGIQLLIGRSRNAASRPSTSEPREFYVETSRSFCEMKILQFHTFQLHT